jgi:hypothetical protein
MLHISRISLNASCGDHGSHLSTTHSLLIRGASFAQYFSFDGCEPLSFCVNVESLSLRYSFGSSHINKRHIDLLERGLSNTFGIWREHLLYRCQSTASLYHLIGFALDMCACLRVVVLFESNTCKYVYLSISFHRWVYITTVITSHGVASHHICSLVLPTLC